MVSFGGLAEIVPLFYDAQTVKPAPGVKPYEPLRLAGKDVYVREGCYLCHSQMIRTLRVETQRYGHVRRLANLSTTDRSSGDRSARGRTWRASAANIPTPGSGAPARPRGLVPRSNMPAYPWLEEAKIDGKDLRPACAPCACSAIRTVKKTSRVRRMQSPTRPSSTR